MDYSTGMVSLPQAQDPFIIQRQRFTDLVTAAKKEGRFRLPALLDATHIYAVNAHSLLKEPDILEYRRLVDEEVYAHITRRLHDIVEVIRGHIHKKELDLAVQYVPDMHMLGEFVKEKNLSFDFEFYDKIERFFASRKKAFASKVLPYSSVERDSDSL